MPALLTRLLDWVILALARKNVPRNRRRHYAAQIATRMVE
jgi:hypothetical protein